MLRTIGLIPDGNRRWARERGLPVMQGHYKGADVLEDFLDWCLERGIKNVVIYALSEDNLRRSREELMALFKLYEQRFYKALKDPKIHKNKVRIEVLSTSPEALPTSLLDAIGKIMEATKQYAKHCVKILLAWSAQKEIFQALAKAYEFARKNLPLPNPQSLLLVRDYPDLVIRTGGEQRISDFLSVQLRYSEIYTINKLFPACNRGDWNKALRWFESRQRRFGR
jgi:tritrans,polycis-undecaprenyl-diphosphate synthase [geranylgeranyl-diphosphate specific]